MEFHFVSGGISNLGHRIWYLCLGHLSGCPELSCLQGCMWWVIAALGVETHRPIIFWDGLQIAFFKQGIAATS
jgi:hypothetical protein